MRASAVAVAAALAALALAGCGQSSDEGEIPPIAMKADIQTDYDERAAGAAFEASRMKLAADHSAAELDGEPASGYGSGSGSRSWRKTHAPDHRARRDGGDDGGDSMGATSGDSAGTGGDGYSEEYEPDEDPTGGGQEGSDEDGWGPPRQPREPDRQPRGPEKPRRSAPENKPKPAPRPEAPDLPRVTDPTDSDHPPSDHNETADVDRFRDHRKEARAGEDKRRDARRHQGKDREEQTVGGLRGRAGTTRGLDTRVALPLAVTAAQQALDQARTDVHDRRYRQALARLRHARQQLLRAGAGGRDSAAAPLLGRVDRLLTQVQQTLQARPRRFLPRVGYFANTYLGGNGAALERRRALDQAWRGEKAYLDAALRPQPFDPPSRDALSLTATLDRAGLDGPGRVMLQIGLRGSERYGWRRPPLETLLVIDGHTLQRRPQQARDLVLALMRKLGHEDRLGILVTGPRPIVICEPKRLSPLRTALAGRLQTLHSHGSAQGTGLGTALPTIARFLTGDSGESVPGTRTLLLLTDDLSPRRVEEARGVAHRLALAGVVTSVVQIGDQTDRRYWTVADAGQGSYHIVDGSEASLASAVDDELASLARVVARLLRINIRLGPDARAIRILGSQMLTRRETRRVKAREEATDRQLSRVLGVQSDRGEDDDGLQTVIPYFQGGDEHVILVELWVERPGTVAEVSMKYKDMVRLTNGELHACATLDALPRALTPLQEDIHANAARFDAARHLRNAATWLRRGDLGNALQELQRARVDEGLTQLVDELTRRAHRAWGQPPRVQLVANALDVAAERLLGHSSER